MRNPHSKPVLSFAYTGIIVAGSIVTAFFLVPKSDVMLERLVADGKHKRAIAVAKHSKQNEVFEEKSAYTSNLGDALEAYYYNEPKPLIVLLKELREQEEPLTPKVRQKLYNTIASRALWDENPDFAADTYIELSNKQPLDEEVLEKAIVACRFCERNQDAVELFHKYESAFGPPQSENLRRQRIQICRELELSSEAYRLIYAECNGDNLEEWLPQLLGLANELGKEGEVIPLYKKFVSSLPLGSVPATQITQEHRNTTHLKFTRFNSQLAQFCLWTDQFSESFEAHLKLAALGDLKALDMSLELNDFLNRDLEMVQVLHNLWPIEGREDLGLSIARIFAGNEEYGKAETYYKGWLETHPEDSQIIAELGFLYQRKGDNATALPFMNQAFAIDPGNIELASRYASLLSANGDPKAGLEVYKKVPKEAFNPRVAELYAMLADALGAYDTLLLAERIRFDLAAQVTAYNYLDLARACELSEADEEQHRVLSKGFSQYPDHFHLRLGLAHALGKLGKNEEAFHLLAIPKLKGNLKAMVEALSYAEIAGLHQEALDFVGVDAEKIHAFPSATLPTIAAIYEETGYLRRAEVLHSSLPDNPEKWQELAWLCHLQGKHLLASEYQNRFLRDTQSLDSEEWEFLGDLYEAAGDMALREEAYQKALSLMQLDLVTTNH